MSNMRDSLNKVNTVFSEDTQRGTDRIVRIILQGMFFFLNLQLPFLPTSPTMRLYSPSLSCLSLLHVSLLSQNLSASSLNSHIYVIF